MSNLSSLKYSEDENLSSPRVLSKNVKIKKAKKVPVLKLIKHYTMKTYGGVDV
jgi:hypothetical protein